MDCPAVPGLFETLLGAAGWSCEDEEAVDCPAVPPLGFSD